MSTKGADDLKNPLKSLDEWEDSVLARYSEKTEYRDYDGAADRVREFYRLNHHYQTVDFVRRKREEYLPLRKKKMTVWEAIEYLNTLVDESDPDTELSQIEHLMQTAEAIRRDGHPRWFVLVGLIHDLGKVLCLYGEPQWAVVGDTFPVGCAYSEKIVYPEFFAENPDSTDTKFNTRLGIYEEGGGLDRAFLSWGHDEYLYQVVRDYLPEEALYTIRYHSFYAAHREGAYAYLMNDRDRAGFEWVRRFNPYDLYSKGEAAPDMAALTRFYRNLVEEFFPGPIDW
jgi:inositol oxygenase